MKSAVVTVARAATSIDWKFMIYEESHVALMILSISSSDSIFLHNNRRWRTFFVCGKYLINNIYLMSVHVCVVVVVGSCDTMNYNTSKTKKKQLKREDYELQPGRKF